MATGRTLAEFQRLYIDGYDMSGYSFDSGEQSVDFGSRGGEEATFSDIIRGSLVGKPNIGFGPVNGVFDNTATSGIHATAIAAQGTPRKVMLPQGIRAAPAMGDEVFCAPVVQTAYKGVTSGGLSTCRIDFGGYDAAAGLNYDEFWGKLIHAWGSEGAANSANTNVDNGAATTAGGWLMWMIYSVSGGAGTVTVSIDDSANGTSWLALSGATSGAIAYNAVPAAGIVQLATNATVRQYLRWQYAESSATDAIFALAFMRGR